MTDAPLPEADDAAVTGPPTAGWLVQSWLVLSLALVFGIGLALMHIFLSPLIAANIRQEIERQAPHILGVEHVELIQQEVDGRRVFAAHDPEGTLIGWVVPASGSGFGGPIELILGLDAQATTLAGIYIITQTETPGLGDFITADGFTTRFRQQPAAVRMDTVTTPSDQPGAIQAITGATISSQAVCTIVNDGLRLRQALNRAAREASHESE